MDKMMDITSLFATLRNKIVLAIIPGATFLLAGLLILFAHLFNKEWPLLLSLIILTVGLTANTIVKAKLLKSASLKRWYLFLIEMLSGLISVALLVIYFNTSLTECGVIFGSYILVKSAVTGLYNYDKNIFHHYKDIIGGIIGIYMVMLPLKLMVDLRLTAAIILTLIGAIMFYISLQVLRNFGKQKNSLDLFNSFMGDFQSLESSSDSNDYIDID